jgi:hypothetical protein
MFTKEQIGNIKHMTKEWKEDVERGRLVDYDTLINRIMKADDLPKSFGEAQHQLVMAISGSQNPLQTLVTIRLLWDTVLSKWQDELTDEDIQAAVFLSLDGTPLRHLTVRNDRRNFFGGENDGNSGSAESSRN